MLGVEVKGREKVGIEGKMKGWWRSSLAGRRRCSFMSVHLGEATTTIPSKSPANPSPLPSSTALTYLERKSLREGGKSSGMVGGYVISNLPVAIHSITTPCRQKHTHTHTHKL